MTSIVSFIRKLNETDRYSRGYITSLQEVKTITSKVGRALANASLAGEVLSFMIEVATRLARKIRSPFLTRFVIGMPPILELEGGQIGKDLLSTIESLKLSISWTIAPLTEFIESLLRKLRREARRSRVTGALRRQVLLQRPLTLETKAIVGDYRDRIMGIGYQTHETTSAIRAMVSLDYPRKIPREVQRVFDTIRRKGGEAYDVGALLATPPKMEEMEAISEVSKSIGETPSIPLTVPETMKSWYVRGIPEVSRISRPVAVGLGEAYHSSVLNKISPFAEAVSEKVTGTPNVKALGILRRYAPTTADVEALGYDSMRHGPAEMHAAKPLGVRPPVETIVIDALLEKMRSFSEIVSGRAAGVYDAGVRALVEMLPAAEAVEGIREVSEKLVVPTSAHPAMTKTSRYFSAVSDAGAVPQSIAERSAEVYSVRFHGIAPSPLKGVGEKMAGVNEVGVPIAGAAPVAVEAVSMVSGVMRGLSLPRFPTEEVVRMGREGLTIPEVKRVIRLITKRVSEIFMSEVLSLTPPPVEAVAERVVEASGIVFPKTLTMYLPAGTVFGKMRAVSRGIPSVIRPLSTVETARAVSSYVSIVSRMSHVSDVLGAISREAVASGVDTRRGLVDGVSRVGLPSIVEGVVSKVGAEPLRGGVEEYGLGKVSLGLPSVMRTVKLHEIVPILYALRLSAAAVERQPVINNTFNITITARSLEDESDLRSLGRKIRRILEREARRYGVSV